MHFQPSELIYQCKIYTSYQFDIDYSDFRSTEFEIEALPGKGLP